MVEKRKLVATDEASFYALTLYAFNKQGTPERELFFKHLFQNSEGYGIEKDDRIQSGLLGTPFKVNFHGTTFKMSGIGYVASYPEFSGHGGISQLMRLAFEDMQAQNITLSYLAPFSYGFYRRFGYEEVFDQAEFQIAMQDLPRLKIDSSTGSIQRLSLKEAVPVIAAFHNQHPDNQAGGVVREKWWWAYDVMKHPSWEVAVFYDQQKLIKGYVIYERQGSTLAVIELMATTVASQQQLVNFLFKHQSAYEKLTYTSASVEQVHDLLPDPRIIQTKILPYMMARIVNLKDFLERYPYQQTELETVCLNVTDDFLAENSGVYQLSVHAGQVTLSKLQQAKVDLTLSIQNLTKAMMGYRSLQSLLNYGQIVGNAQAAKRLDAMLTHEKPMLWDYF